MSGALATRSHGCKRSVVMPEMTVRSGGRTGRQSEFSDIKNGVIAFWLIVMGLFAMWASATNGIRHWSMLVFGLKICDAIFLACGLSLLAAGAWLLLMGTKPRFAAAVGAVAAGVFVVTLAAGVWSGAIPCTSPG